jgi:hypothetical protein
MAMTANLNDVHGSILRILEILESKNDAQEA